MNTKAEVLKAREEIAMNILKQKYGFMYEQLIKEARPALEDKAEGNALDELNDHANDGLHTEHVDSHHSDTSTSVDFGETKKIMDNHQETLNLIAEIYAE